MFETIKASILPPKTYCFDSRGRQVADTSDHIVSCDISGMGATIYRKLSSGSWDGVVVKRSVFSESLDAFTERVLRVCRKSCIVLDRIDDDSRDVRNVLLAGRR